MNTSALLKPMHDLAEQRDELLLACRTARRLLGINQPADAADLLDRAIKRAAGTTPPIRVPAEMALIEDDPNDNWRRTA